MFCKNCGTQLSNDAVFCHKCAQPANAPHQVYTPQPQVVVHPPAKTIIVRKNSSFSTALFTVLLLFIGVVGFYSYQKYHQETIISIPGIGKITKDRDNFYVYGDTDTQSTPTSKKSSSQQTQSSTSQTSSGGSQASVAHICVVSNNGNSVNIRTNCDTQDCYNDNATIGGAISDGTEVNVLSLNTIESGHSFVWMPIEVTNGTGWIASSKLDCSNAAAF